MSTWTAQPLWVGRPDSPLLRSGGLGVGIPADKCALALWIKILNPEPLAGLGPCLRSMLLIEGCDKAAGSGFCGGPGLI